MPTPKTIEQLRDQFLQWKGHPLAGQANPVFGHGNPHAQIVFIGEAPGQREDEQGIPFVGPAGQLLEKLLETIGLQREDVYITNVVKHRPPGNRDPLPAEKEAYMPWLQMELALIRPKVIVPLGRHALGHFFTKLNITQAHGKPQKLPNGMAVFPIYHPAAALHNPGLKQALFDDFAALGAYLAEQKTTASAVR